MKRAQGREEKVRGGRVEERYAVDTLDSHGVCRSGVRDWVLFGELS